MNNLKDNSKNQNLVFEQHKHFDHAAMHNIPDQQLQGNGQC
jgi:hypothetical protein